MCFGEKVVLARTSYIICRSHVLGVIALVLRQEFCLSVISVHSQLWILHGVYCLVMADRGADDSK